MPFKQKVAVSSQLLVRGKRVLARLRLIFPVLVKN
jgi:hypothetical protein